MLKSFAFIHTVSLFLSIIPPIITIALLRNKNSAFTFGKTFSIPLTIEIGTYAVYVVIALIGYISIWIKNRLLGFAYSFYYLLSIAFLLASTIVFFRSDKYVVQHMSMLYNTPSFINSSSITYIHTNLTCCGLKSQAINCESIYNTTNYNTTCETAAFNAYKKCKLTLQIGNVLVVIVCIVRLIFLIFDIFHGDYDSKDSDSVLAKFVNLS